MNASHKINLAMRRARKLAIKFTTLELAKEIAIKAHYPQHNVELLATEARRIQDRAHDIGQTIHAT